MEEKILMLSEKIDRLEERVLNLEYTYHKIRNRKNHYETISKEMIVDILSQAISKGTLKENSEEYVLDKKIVHLIAHEKNIKKYDFNKSLKKMDFIVRQNSQDFAYKQVRVEGKNIWVYVINKKLFKKAMEV